MAVERVCRFVVVCFARLTLVMRYNGRIIFRPTIC